MGLISKDPAKEQAKAEARAEKERAAEEARFWASPRGQARKAREEGWTWVQIVAPISETRIGTTGFVTGFTSTDARSRTSDQTDLIESVEAEGWKLGSGRHRCPGKERLKWSTPPAGLIRGPGGIRTRGTRVKSPLL